MANRYRIRMNYCTRFGNRGRRFESSYSDHMEKGPWQIAKGLFPFVLLYRNSNSYAMYPPPNPLAGT